jgi:tRNA threonylcarbamoyl adenosine modification protein YjeE
MPPAFAESSRRTFSSESQLSEFAAAFARRLRPGDVVALSGPLGAGKTSFVRAVVRELHGSDPTSSPTFTFWHRYAGEPPIDHIDAFRIQNPAEIPELGLEEAFEGDSIVLIEWSERLAQLLPERRYDIAIDGAGDQPRTVALAEPRQ